MKALIISKNLDGLDKELKPHILENTQTVDDILNYLYSKGLNKFNFKYCMVEDQEIIPRFFRIKEGFSNVITKFNIDRITYREFPCTEEEKEKMIITRLEYDKNIQLDNLYSNAHRLLIDKELGFEGAKDKFIEIGSKIEDIKTKNIALNNKIETTAINAKLDGVISSLHHHHRPHSA